MKTRLQTLIGLAVLGAGLVVAAIMGLFAYMSLTATPMHPDASAVKSVTLSPPPEKWAGAVERARQIARAGVTEQNLPGLSVAVGAGGEIVWAEGFGWTDLETRETVSPETRFRIGEASKALTSAAVGLLLEEKKLNLDDEIQAYVPDYPKKQYKVTLRHLMGQVAGLRDDPGDEASLEPCEQTLDGLRLFADHDLLFEPGTRHQRSSYGWILVSAAVEEAGDERFFRFMRSRVFEPLGMTATRPYSAREELPDRATSYFPKFAGDPRYGPQSAREGDHTCYAGGAAFLSTPSDLVRFGMAIARGRLLKPETVQLLQTALRLPSGEETGYGLGWAVESLPLAGEPTRMAGHGTKGDFIGGTPYLMTFPDRDLVVAATTNISFADMKSIALQIADAFAAPGRGQASAPRSPGRGQSGPGSDLVFQHVAQLRRSAGGQISHFDAGCFDGRSSGQITTCEWGLLKNKIRPQRWLTPALAPQRMLKNKI
jgi:CubicO group peptidase (beta-lactamase class C family)